MCMCKCVSFCVRSCCLCTFACMYAYYVIFYVQQWNNVANTCCRVEGRRPTTQGRASRLGGPKRDFKCGPLIVSCAPLSPRLQMVGQVMLLVKRWDKRLRYMRFHPEYSMRVASCKTCAMDFIGRIDAPSHHLGPKSDYICGERGAWHPGMGAGLLAVKSGFILFIKSYQFPYK
jgi:hypothetical protein